MDLFKTESFQKLIKYAESNKDAALALKLSELAIEVEHAKDDLYAIKFANWLDTLRITQRVSVWSKDGSTRGIFSMDNEQLLSKYKKVLSQSKYNHIVYDGHDYWYEYRIARNKKDLCLSTKDPEQYCNGLYLYSDKDIGSGKAFVVVKTNNLKIKLS